MRRSIAIAFTLLLFSAFGFVTLSDADDVTRSSSTVAPAARPVKATWSGTSTVVGTCQDGRIHEISSATGFATLAGLSTLSGSECVDPGTGVATGNTVITAANGDVIILEYSQQNYVDPLNPLEGTFSQIWTVTGGTGRFAGATGGGTATGTWIFTSPVFNWAAVVTGEMFY